MRIPHNLVPMLILAVVSAFGGCSHKAAKATSEDVERAFGTKITGESEGRFKLTSFKKTAEESGVGEGDFSWAFEAEVECTQNGVWLFDRVTGSTLIDFRTAAAGTAAQQEGKPIQAGDRFTIVGALHFEKGKGGWQVSVVKMRRFPRKIP